MMLRLAYLGEKFHGFVRQPGLRTVEGDLLEKFEEIGYRTKIHCGSRTDKGVSALSNVIKVDVQDDSMCRRLTVLLEDIWVHGYSLEEWNPRHGIKHYIYFLQGLYDIEKLRMCCSLFSGVHDFSSFTREENKSTLREIEVFHQVKGDVVLLHFVGKSFLWEMIRRCVTGMREYLSGKRTEEEISSLLEGGKKEKIAPSPAENLLLKDIVCKFPFLADEYSLERMKKEFRSYYETYSVRKALADEFLHFQK